MRTPVSRFEKVAGYFILLTLSLLVALIVVPGMKRGGFLNKSLFTIHVLADDGLDLSAGDKVMMQGIQIGEIEGLELVNRKVMITCRIYRKYRRKITRDAKVFLLPAAVVGRSKIDIHPGTSSSVMSGYVLDGILKTSVTERVEKLLGQAGSVIANADSRIGELKATLTALQRILDRVNAGEGSLGRFVHSEDFYLRAARLLERMESSADVVGRLREPVIEFSESLPLMSKTLTKASDQIDDILTNLQKGMKEFPQVTSKTVIALAEGRKILESLKRSFFIRGNLPRDIEPPGTAPASRRELPPME